VGCGHGATLEALAVAFPSGRFQGLDFSDVQVRLARKRTRHLPNVSFTLGDARLGLPAELGAFDEVLSIYGAFDFSNNPALMMDAFLRRLKAGGACTVLTSVREVFDAVVHESSLEISRTLELGTRWFVRATLSR